MALHYISILVNNFKSYRYACGVWFKWRELPCVHASIEGYSETGWLNGCVKTTPEVTLVKLGTRQPIGPISYTGLGLQQGIIFYSF